MPVYRLPEDPEVFPDPTQADPNGLLAVGGDLSPVRLVTAYALGVFPWFSAGEPILWWSPDPRLILEPARFHVSRSLRRTLRRGRFEVRCDTAFERVIERCADKPRDGQDGTWITPEMQAAFIDLYRLGVAHSFETWEDGELVGGIYGVSLGAAFFGESMYHDATDASKVAMASLARTLADWDFELLDCQMETRHLRSLGAELIPRTEFLKRLEHALQAPTRQGRWSVAPLQW